MSEPHPTRLSAAIFNTKATLLRANRALANASQNLPLHPQLPTPQFPYTAAQSITPLYTDPDKTEQWYQTGKVTNLAIAAARLHNTQIPAHAIFSFWKQVGKATTRKGYQPGRMLQEGCMIPAIGGGLCQLSNALYQVALDSGCDILERHRHSRLVPGSATAAGRDATVAWNYIDLRFRPHNPLQLTVELTPTHLIVALRSSIATPQPLPSLEPIANPIHDDHACDTCHQHDCFRKHS